ncbi:hypothetical protein [Chryseobacterium indoltheticum]|uniref:hypothetical protein n=1 Tax=Chryseobacterium indoltheticum TaxID=254 RepID=UPI003F49A9C7
MNTKKRGGDAKQKKKRKRLALEEDLKEKEIPEFKFEEEQKAAYKRKHYPKYICKLFREEGRKKKANFLTHCGREIRSWRKEVDAIAKADLESFNAKKICEQLVAGLPYLLLLIKFCF